MTFKDALREKLKGILSEEESLLLPAGFQTVGRIIVLKLNPKLNDKKCIIGQAYLDLLPTIKSVYLNTGKIEGTFRTPQQVELIAGENNPIAEHKENGVIYRFDVTKIMFSKGNVNERKFLTKVVNQNEIIVDMFAGIGYFSIPIGKHSHAKKIFSIELNPYAYKFLVENVKLNHLEDKIIPILGDSKVEVVKLSDSGVKADRVIMGVFPAPKDFIKEALLVGKKSGAIYHYEGVVEKEKYFALFKEFKEIAEKEKFKCTLNSYRFVKSYGPNLYHVVLDIEASKIN